MYSLLKRPNTQQVQRNLDKTLALKIMSLDLNTTEKTCFSRNKVRLPSIKEKKTSK